MTLNRLLFAELRRIWGQSLAICAVLACGVATIVLSASTVRSLEFTCEKYYRQFRFGEVFVPVTRAPASIGRRLAEIEGVEHVDTRVVRSVILDVPGMVEAASCRLISLSEEHPGRQNLVHLRQGRMPQPDRRGEVLASEVFAEAHGLTPGDEVTVIMNGRRERLRIVGLGMSPEYVYSLPPGQLLPDNRHFGVLWMPYRQLASAFNMEGAFNSASLILHPHASVEEVIAKVDQVTARHGGLGAYDRGEQGSHRRVADEIYQVENMSFIWPAVFLAVSAFLFNLVFSRLVRQRQEEIATLRAFGYGPLQIGWLYVKLLLILIGGGVLLGSIVGVLLAKQMMSLYAQFFRFPVLYFEVDWRAIPQAALISTAIGLGGGFAAIRRAMRLPPAVAMRPETPTRYRRSLIERLGLAPLISTTGMMVFRRLERHLPSTLLSVLGMALGVAVVVLGSFIEDTVNYVVDIQFSRSQRQDVMVTLVEAASPGARYDVAKLPGVQAVESFRGAAARLSAAGGSRRVGLMGLEPNPQMFRVLDEDYQPVPIEAVGLTISEKLAELLGVRVGDTVDIEFLENRRRRVEAPVAAIFRDYGEPAAYLRKSTLHRLLQESDRHSGFFLTVDSQHMDQLHLAIKHTPAVASITVKGAALESFKELFSASQAPMRIVYAVFASIISFGVIFNCALITMAERSRDLATLRVIGFTRREVSSVLLGELAVITLASIPLGLPIGYGFAAFAVAALDTETHRFPLVISNATFAYAAVVTLVAAAISAWTVRGRVDKLDLIGVLKVKE